jgi:outer membrane lipoprotein SlyB
MTLQPALPLSVTLVLALLAAAPAAHAQTTTTGTTPAASYEAASKQAAERLKSDQDLCNGESTPRARMACKRDAKADYDKALADAKALKASTASPTAKGAAAAAVTACADCGKVLAVREVNKQGEGSALGVIGGGVAGALLGHQVGGGRGKDLATIAGGVGGAFAGNEIEKRVRAQKVWVVDVQFAQGENATPYEFAQDPGFKAGDVVRKSGTSIARP